MIRYIRYLIAYAAFAFASAAHADYCSDLDNLTQNAKDKSSNASSLRLTSLPEGAKCSSSLSETGTRSIHCAMGFDYRAEVASATFKTIIADTKACIETTTQAKKDQDVNHPDFYDLRSFETDKSKISISLKDKGALQMTYVFLRVEAR